MSPSTITLRSSNDWDEWLERVVIFARRYDILDLISNRQQPQPPTAPDSVTFRNSKGIDNWNDNDWKVFNLLE